MFCVYSFTTLLSLFLSLKITLLNLAASNISQGASLSLLFSSFYVNELLISSHISDRKYAGDNILHCPYNIGGNSSHARDSLNELGECCTTTYILSRNILEGVYSPFCIQSGYTYSLIFSNLPSLAIDNEYIQKD